MIVEENAVPVERQSVEEKYEVPCPVCGYAPIAVVTETERGTTAYLSESVTVCEDPEPPSGEAVYYLHFTDHP